MRFYLSFLALFTSFFTFSQTIINTETLLVKIDSSTTVFRSNLEADFNFGNIELLQVNNSISLGTKIKNNLIRLSFGYEYISENKEIIANDWTGQIRLNHLINDNSFFVFLQGQNVVSLSMKHRYLLGGGYRFRLLNKESNYFDFSGGLFYENELYTDLDESLIQINNFRYSFSSFFNIKLSNQIDLNTSLFYQINTKNTKDYRLYIEPRLYFNFNKISLYSTIRDRFHSTPYIDVCKRDTELLFGIELNL